MVSWKESGRDGRRLRAVLYSRPLLVLLAMLVLLLGHSVLGVAGKYVKSRGDRHLAEEKLREVQRRTERVGGEITALETRRGREAILRERYDAVLPGEKVVKIIEGS